MKRHVCGVDCDGTQLKYIIKYAPPNNPSYITYWGENSWYHDIDRARRFDTTAEGAEIVFSKGWPHCVVVVVP